MVRVKFKYDSLDEARLKVKNKMSFIDYNSIWFIAIENIMIFANKRSRRRKKKNSEARAYLKDRLTNYEKIIKVEERKGKIKYE